SGIGRQRACGHGQEGIGQRKRAVDQTELRSVRGSSPVGGVGRAGVAKKIGDPVAIGVALERVWTPGQLSTASPTPSRSSSGTAENNFPIDVCPSSASVPEPNAVWRVSRQPFE
ncbi:MAG: hypothetical protein ACREA0_32405, partial [bacterium]